MAGFFKQASCTAYWYTSINTLFLCLTQRLRPFQLAKLPPFWGPPRQLTILSPNQNTWRRARRVEISIRSEKYSEQKAIADSSVIGIFWHQHTIVLQQKLTGRQTSSVITGFEPYFTPEDISSASACNTFFTACSANFAGKDYARAIPLVQQLAHRWTSEGTELRCWGPLLNAVLQNYVQSKDRFWKIGPEKSAWINFLLLK